MEYPKIETYFNRDPKTFKVTDEVRCPEFELIDEWLLTEKIDGTNIRVIYKQNWEITGCLGACGWMQKPIGRSVEFMGRTAKAQIPKHLLEYLQKTFPIEKFDAAFPDIENATMRLFGEGYGAKIQKGGNYRPKDVSFRLFDVFIEDRTNPLGGWWLERLNVGDIARKLGIRTVHVIGLFNTKDAVEYCQRSPLSFVSWNDSGQDYGMEGVVARTMPLLFTRRGRRVMWKLKVSDFEK